MADAIRLDGKIAIITGHVLECDGGGVSHMSGQTGLQAFFSSSS